MPKKSYGRILAKMLARFAQDADPEELEEAVDAVEDITSPAEEPAAPAPQPPVPEQDAGDDVIQQILNRLDALEKKNGATDEDPEEDPLAKMEKELDAMEGAEEEPVVAEEKEEEFVTPDEDPDEVESHFIDPEKINEGDEDEVTEEEVTEIPSEDCKGRDAARIALNAIKPIIAALPANQRKKAADAAVAQIRKASGLSEKPGKNQYIALKKPRKKASDSTADVSEIGKAIMARRNPHYKNK